MGFDARQITNPCQQELIWMRLSIIFVGNLDVFEPDLVKTLRGITSRHLS